MTPHEAYRKCKNENERAEELEKIIASDVIVSLHYIANVIKKPFPLCHPVIFNSTWKDDYLKFLKSINYDLNEIEEWLI
jgi:hypothetical protein